AGVGSLAAAALVGFIGYYKLSGEPLVNRQLPYLASAGMTLVVLVVLGGSLLVAEQMRNDAGRIEELENAVASLADTLSPLLESPARRREPAVVAAPSRTEDVRAEIGTDETVRIVPTEPPAAPQRAKRTAARKPAKSAAARKPAKSAAARKPAKRAPRKTT
ncbi:MAG: hypothetical protein LC640_06485, partial [Frankia sp.]|nr:hypothetical protein [Frankia sp.]